MYQCLNKMKQIAAPNCRALLYILFHKAKLHLGTTSIKIEQKPFTPSIRITYSEEDRSNWILNACNISMVDCMTFFVMVNHVHIAFTPSPVVLSAEAAIGGVL